MRQILLVALLCAVLVVGCDQRSTSGVPPYQGLGWDTVAEQIRESNETVAELERLLIPANLPPTQEGRVALAKRLESISLPFQPSSLTFVEWHGVRQDMAKAIAEYAALCAKLEVMLDHLKNSLRSPFLRSKGGNLVVTVKDGACVVLERSTGSSTGQTMPVPPRPAYEMCKAMHYDLAEADMSRLRESVSGGSSRVGMLAVGRALSDQVTTLRGKP